MPETIDVTLEDLQGAVTGLVEDIRTDFAELTYVDTLVEMHRELEEEHTSNFAMQQTPGGDPHTPLAPATVKRKGHSITLIEKHRLRRSLTNRTEDSIREVISEPGPTGQHGLSFGTYVPYSIFHQDGTPTIPQREHVGTNDEYVDRAAEKVADATVRKLKERRQ